MSESSISCSQPHDLQTGPLTFEPTSSSVWFGNDTCISLPWRVAPHRAQRPAGAPESPNATCGPVSGVLVSVPVAAVAQPCPHVQGVLGMGVRGSESLQVALPLASPSWFHPLQVQGGFCSLGSLPSSVLL